MLCLYFFIIISSLVHNLYERPPCTKRRRPCTLTVSSAVADAPVPPNGDRLTVFPCAAPITALATSAATDTPRIFMRIIMFYLSTSLFVKLPPPRPNEKAAPRACPVEATGMPKGITHVTPPSMRRLRMTRGTITHATPRPRRFGTAVLCCASPYRTITSLSTGYGGIIPQSP